MSRTTESVLKPELARTPEWEATLAEIAAGLLQPQKELPSTLFYDERGSQLFDEITRLPEYYLTRAEQALLREHGPGWIAGQLPRSLVELGPGSAIKTRIILDTMNALSTGVTYVPLDISAGFLDRTAAALRREYPQLTVVPVTADFTRSLVFPFPLPFPALITFLGSTIGNFTLPAAVDLLRRVRATMRSGDRFLLGVDLRKDAAMLEAAYDDARGVTAAFNLNMLRVVNRRFGADFDIDAFRHRAFYDSVEHRIEMHLVSTRKQTVHIARAGHFVFDEGETIRTEISNKYDRQSVADIFAAAGLVLLEWREAPDMTFALCFGAPAA